MRAERSFPFSGPLDLRRTLAPLRSGARDPTWWLGGGGLAHAMHTPDGPVTLALRAEPGSHGGRGRLLAEAWGPGASWALDHAAAFAGLEDVLPDPATLAPPLDRLAARAAGVRLARTHRVVELLVHIVLGQLVAGREAKRAWHRLVAACAEPAPGPLGLALPPSAEALLALPPAAFPPLGVLPRQAATLHRIAAAENAIEETASLPLRAAARRLAAIPGLGKWSVGSALLYGLGDPDALPLGDYNLPSFVSQHLSGVREADDARMLALLEPWRGQRGRMLRWLGATAPGLPRRAPRAALRSLGTI